MENTSCHIKWWLCTTVRQEIFAVLNFSGLLKCGKLSNIHGTNFRGLGSNFHINSIGTTYKIFNFHGEDTCKIHEKYCSHVLLCNCCNHCNYYILVL